MTAARMLSMMSLAFCLLWFLASPAVAEEGPKFLILHLDGVSAQDFYEAGAKGELPNLWTLFEEDLIVRRGLTLFPGGTEVIYPRLKMGLDNSEFPLVGWGYLDRDSDTAYYDHHVLFEMYSHFPRRSRSQYFLGFPFLRHINGLYLRNVPSLFTKYDVLEFFWYNTDVAGHLWGEEAHRRSMVLFDHYVGYLLDWDGLDEVNVVLYTDHGMTFGDIQRVNVPEVLDKHIGDNLRFYSYPNVYLYEDSEAQTYAENVAKQSAVDFAFVRLGENRVRGYHDTGSIDIWQVEDQFCMDFEGLDPLGYAGLDCAGRCLDADQWLQCTGETLYPGVPPNLFRYLENPYTGDIVVVLNPNKIPHSSIGDQGGHAGFHHSDLMVPLAFRGPDVQHMRDRDHLWLHELFERWLPMVDFDSVPDRDWQYAHWYTGFGGPSSAGGSLVLSPAYRWQAALDIQDSGFGGWLAYDVISSFAGRFWLGVGADRDGFSLYRGMDLSVGDWHGGARWRGDSNAEYFIHYAVVSDIRVGYSSRGGFGVQVRF